MTATSLFPDVFLTIRNTTVAGPDTLQIGDWRAHRDEGRIRRGAESRMLEPKVMDLLFVLASRPNHVFSRDALMGALWPDTTVGEDALSRCVFKLRKALEGPSRAGARIETIPKRGYRLVADVAPVPAGDAAPHRPRGAVVMQTVALLSGVGVLAGAALILFGPVPAPPVAAPAEGPAVQRAVARAADSYYQFTRADNEAAIVLYERALDREPASPEALAGLAGALVQRHMRWPDGRDAPRPAGSALRAALASGSLAGPAAQPDLRRALALAQRAAALRPHDPEVQRALGLALSVRGRLDAAATTYDHALAEHPDDWGLLINRADLHDIAGQSAEALPLLERAYDSMDRAYAAETVRVRPWQAELGVEIGRRYEARSDIPGARAWYRRTLADAPSASAAAERLAALSGPGLSGLDTGKRG